MVKRTMGEMITHFNDTVSTMDISINDKMILLGMITAIGYECQKAADAIEELQKPKWIPVKERLPEEKCKCLVYKKHTGLSALVSFTNDLESIDEYDFQGQNRWGFFYYDSEYGYCESLGVTHWMPMPEPPKDGG